ncbi:MAG: phenylalanine--tRNA ligase subunit beta [Verrucomicrobiota bacterium]|nr:phenylalanine--tRNA ligase subunit beta [Verrucomicrobiota bacterium]
MKISVQWLKDYVDFDWSADELADKLTVAGIEVEGIEVRGANFDHVVVAEILESNKHPNADKLSVCKVTTDGTTTKQIVCGAKNYRVGDRIPLAQPGAILPGGFAIKESKLRGELSQGMMCSAKELGLAADADGLLILPKDTPLGIPISEVFPTDTIFEVEITPNRPDLLSHFGLARELVALGARNLRPPEINFVESEEPVDGFLKIENSVQIDCPLYIGRVAQGAKVAPSPEWMRRRLEAIGVRSINNVVDITNFVLHELGQPLHAFDGQKLKGGKIIIRHARKGEKILALDGKEYALEDGMTVIADETDPTAIAGVMGGEKTGVDDSTSHIVLESAIFSPSKVRRTSRHLTLGSDSSYRFERGIDPEGVDFASRRATSLLAQIAGAKIFRGKIELRSTTLVPARQIELRASRVRKLLGCEIPSEKIQSILRTLHLCVAEGAAPETWAVTVPSFRRDLIKEIDLIEEISRILGLDDIPSILRATVPTISMADKAAGQVNKLRRSLNGVGLSEILTHKLIDEKLESVNHAACGLNSIKLLNPLSADQNTLRSSLIGNLLQTLALNRAHQNHSLALFEAGKVFLEFEDKLHERLHLSLGLCGIKHAKSWMAAEESYTFFDLKAVVEAIGTAFGLGTLEFRKLSLTNSQEKVFELVAETYAHKKRLGFISILSYDIRKSFGLPEATFVGELDLTHLLIPSEQRPQVTAPAKFPASTRDVALLVPQTITNQQIIHAFQKHAPNLLERIELFDIFTDNTGQKLPADKKSMAYSLTYRSLDKTLTDQEINQAHDQLRNKAAADVGATFRE